MLSAVKKRVKLCLAGFSPLNILLLFLAGAINAVGVTIFIAPVNLYDSGISGTSILLAQITPEEWSLSVFLLLLNVPLLLFGLKRQGPLFSLYAIFAVGVYAGTAWLITDILPIDVQFASPLAGTDLFCARFSAASSPASGAVLPFDMAAPWTAWRSWR